MYTQEQVGMMAVNDSSWLVSSAFDLVNEEFRYHPYYSDIIDLIHMVCNFTNRCMHSLGYYSYTRT